MKFRYVRRRGFLGVVLCLSFYVLACGAETYVTHDLVELLPQAKVTTETHLLDIGSAEARFRLVSGWSADETATTGMSFVWARLFRR